MFYLHVRNTTEECTSTLLFSALRSAIQSDMNSAPARVFPSLQLEMLQIKAKPLLAIERYQSSTEVKLSPSTGL